jgi:hypothetical protein
MKELTKQLFTLQRTELEIKRLDIANYESDESQLGIELNEL